MIELLPFLGRLGAAFFRFERKKIADDARIKQVFGVFVLFNSCHTKLVTEMGGLYGIHL
jgi:hypothetical protein